MVAATAAVASACQASVLLNKQTRRATCPAGPVPRRAVHTQAVQIAPATNGSSTKHATQQDWGVATDLLTPPAAGKLVKGQSAYTEEHRVRASEVGPDQRTSIVTIADLMQEVAGNHCVALYGRTTSGFATDPIMVENSLIFAATRIQIQMDVYPKWGDLLKIETWFQPDGRISAQRDWLLLNALTGQRLGRATSSWVMLNTQTRKLSKIPENLRQKIEAFCPNPHEYVFPASETKRKIPDVTTPARWVGPPQSARRTDVDMNGHVNNVTFMTWALEAAPRNLYDGHHLHQLEIDFKSECHFGSTLETLANPVDDADNGNGSMQRLVHSLRRQEDGKEVVRVRTAWTPRS